MNKIEHGLITCTVDNPLAKAWGYLSAHVSKPYNIVSVSYCWINVDT